MYMYIDNQTKILFPSMDDEEEDVPGEQIIFIDFFKYIFFEFNR
jgi:hypothetical protein